MAKKPATNAQTQGFLRDLKKSPFARELFQLLLRAALTGLVETERTRLAELQRALDSDGDGVADADDAEPHNPAVQ